MFHRKLIERQLQTVGLRFGDSCSIYPSHGHKKAFTLNRHCIDLISKSYRPSNLSLSYFELPSTSPSPFHYRLELDDTTPEKGRYVMKTMSGLPFWINGLAAREAYVERQDRLYLDDNKLNFNGCNLAELTELHFENPLLNETQLLESHLKIYIEGETGTGKTHLAQKIHEKSLRLGKFVAINLSSYNPNLIESELFGHKKGSFTGAITDKMGAFQEALHGTLFLDEIDSLPLDLQTKLLTFIDNGKFRRVGDHEEVSIKTRMIFASGKKLEPLVLQGSFRKDFYFRLRSGHSVELIPLRNDGEKVKKICQHYCLEHHLSLSPRLIEFYQSLAWPGNLRQLLGHLEKKKILSRTMKLDFDSTDEELLKESSDLMSFEASSELISMEEQKGNYVKHAVSVCDGNMSQAAKKLRITEKTLKGYLKA